MAATKENGETFIPHILEIAFGTDRPTYALIDLFYNKKDESEGKTKFDIPYYIAPIDVSIFPLMKKEELTNLSEKIKRELEKEFVVDYDVSGSIGKRYLRSAVKGIPFALTIDYDSLNDNSVTIRDRNTESQERIKIENITTELKKRLS
jgi:glycyl-tRNA synthetase